MLLSECYYGHGKDRKKVTVQQALDIKSKSKRFVGECPNPQCKSRRISVYRPSKAIPAHFQHTGPHADESCPYANPSR
jgi:hypothetical protein